MRGWIDRARPRRHRTHPAEAAAADRWPVFTVHGPVAHDAIDPEHRFHQLKDPNLAFDGGRWHLFGTGCGAGGLEVFHATADVPAGPWRGAGPVRFGGGPAMLQRAAPGVVAEGGRLHLFLQQHFDRLGGTVEHYASDDGGHTFAHAGTALRPQPAGPEAGCYDPDPAEVAGVRLLAYAAMAEVGRPELFVATSASGSWAGPWDQRRRVLAHADVPFHNQLRDRRYEWGLEGPQLVELPDGRVLLTAVCFLRRGAAGQRQRVLFAVAPAPEGPFRVLGPLLAPAGGVGENGHGGAAVHDGTLHLVFQERAGAGRPWHLCHATAPLGGG